MERCDVCQSVHESDCENPACYMNPNSPHTKEAFEESVRLRDTEEKERKKRLEFLRKSLETK